MADEKLYADEAAAYVGVSAGTWRRYCTESPGRKRQAPPRDGVDLDRGHARPWWWKSTLTTWKADRPGRGSPGVPRKAVETVAPVEPKPTKKTRKAAK